MVRKAPAILLSTITIGGLDPRLHVANSPRRPSLGGSPAKATVELQHSTTWAIATGP